MADDATSPRSPSLRRRFALWFGLLFVLGTVLIRVAYYPARSVFLRPSYRKMYLWFLPMVKLQIPKRLILLAEIFMPLVPITIL